MLGDKCECAYSGFIETGDGGKKMCKIFLFLAVASNGDASISTLCTHNYQFGGFFSADFFPCPNFTLNDQFSFLRICWRYRLCRGEPIILVWGNITQVDSRVDSVQSDVCDSSFSIQEKSIFWNIYFLCSSFLQLFTGAWFRLHNAKLSEILLLLLWKHFSILFGIESESVGTASQKRKFGTKLF